MNGKIVTTRAKAKAVIGSVEKMVTLSKKGGLASRRKVLGKLDNKREATEVLFKNIAKAFSEKSSGFVRSISLPRRVGDNAQMVRLEWTEKIEYDTKVKEEKKSKKTIKKEEKKEIKKVIKKGEK
ncbi:MAG: 50S ribosomal protein L17 [Candidatus Woesebacteria bacterium GW2011_GWD2_40_19]|nr:MAG: 50S ribosomal protein L17 [Candidatus Woesebacteria bacterium GW2011_GWD2_40_19]